MSKIFFFCSMILTLQNGFGWKLNFFGWIEVTYIHGWVDLCHGLIVSWKLVDLDAVAHQLTCDLNFELSKFTLWDGIWFGDDRDDIHLNMRETFCRHLGIISNQTLNHFIYRWIKMTIKVHIKPQTALVSKYFPFRQLTFNHSGNKLLNTDVSNWKQPQNIWPDKYRFSSSLLFYAWANWINGTQSAEKDCIYVVQRLLQTHVSAQIDISF